MLGRTLRDSSRCNSIELEEGRRNEALNITSRYWCLSPLKNLFDREPIRIRLRRICSKEFGRDQNTALIKGLVQENFWMCGQWGPNRTQKQERSPSGARAELERSTEPRKEYGTPKGPSGSRKDARRLETTLFRNRRISSHSWETPMLINTIRLLLFRLSRWGPVRSPYARPTPSRRRKRSCLITR